MPSQACKRPWPPHVHFLGVYGKQILIQNVDRSFLTKCQYQGLLTVAVVTWYLQSLLKHQQSLLLSYFELLARYCNSDKRYDFCIPDFFPPNTEGCLEKILISTHMICLISTTIQSQFKGAQIDVLNQIFDRFHRFHAKLVQLTRF